MSKKVLSIHGSVSRHWVGDGFPVRTLLHYPEHGRDLSPFLLLDYAGPHQFPPTEKRLGVGEHPHRGFETVTIIYSGEVEHRDSSGAGGKIGPGDVQWMTAASGVVHEEFHGRDFARRGGDFEMVQLWVNLPAAEKMSEPRYQEISTDQIPSWEADGVKVRVIAGDLHDANGPAKTVTSMQVWDLRIEAGRTVQLPVSQGNNAALALLQGEIQSGDSKAVSDVAMIVFDLDGDSIELTAVQDSKLLLLAGEPIDEPIVGQGPFVMNTGGEIRQAISDYRSGNMGRLGNR